MATTSNTKEQQILTASGSRLTLLRLDSPLGKVLMIASHDIFSIIRSIASFRLAGSTKDYIIPTSDPVLELSADRNSFLPVHLETFGKSGWACLVASVEKTKFLYIFNRNAEAEITISSPLEAHRHATFVFSLVALDVGYANPVFVALETDCSEIDQDSSGQTSLDAELVYYELDLGLNHVVLKWSESADPTSSLLFQVPGRNDGPSGVLVCAEESVTYRHSN
ncbi:hypothetical protein F5Y12DRAFT_712142 [Xylaria sp. FL1777]|nr:hypothetical protein F5Y12DRAFT_712142 [Xylaria sp. FL1777]